MNFRKQIFLCLPLLLIFILACGDGSLSPKLGQAKLRIEIGDTQLNSSQKQDDSVRLQIASSEWDAVYVAVVDLSSFENETEMRQSEEWNEYHEAVHQWENGDNGVVSWGGLKKVGSYFPMIVNQTLTEEETVATGIVNAATGINHVIVGLNKGDQVIYGAKQIVMAEGGEVTPVYLYPYRWASESNTPTVNRIEITPSRITLENGQTQNFTAMAYLTDASSIDVTNHSVWSTSPGTSGSIGQTGLFEADATQTGTETVQATYEGVSGQAIVAVNAANVPVNELVMIYGGTFTMARTPREADEQPTHDVTVNDFAMFKYEITQGTWESLMGSNPSSNAGSGLPVESITWLDAVNFCNTLSEQENLTPCYTINGSAVVWDTLATGYRLPTEAEWEYAATGGYWGNQTLYSGSNAVDEVAWYHSNAQTVTQTVGQKTANEYQLYDMTGNVWEWCWDFYEASYYGVSPGNDPKGPDTGVMRVIRGGSCTEAAFECRVVNRESFDAGRSDTDIGFRPVRTVFDPCSFKAMSASPEEKLFDETFTD